MFRSGTRLLQATCTRKMAGTNNASTPKRARENPTFVWTDDEVHLLLTVMNDFKVQKAAENTNWEGIRPKYDIFWKSLSSKCLPPKVPGKWGQISS